MNSVAVAIILISCMVPSVLGCLCHDGWHKLQLDLTNVATFPHIFHEKSELSLAQAGTYMGPQDIAEYVNFALGSSPYIHRNMPKKSTETFQGYDKATGLCTFRTFVLSEFTLATASGFGKFAKTKAPFIHAIILKFFYNPSSHKVDNVIIHYLPSFLGFFFGQLDTPVMAKFICETMKNNCGHVWTYNNITNVTQCVHRFHAIPQLAEPPLWRFDGYCRACRVLHANFASINHAHCPHISFKPMTDMHGKVKCQHFGNKPPGLGLVSKQDFLDFEAYNTEQGIDPKVGYKLMPIPTAEPMKQYVIKGPPGLADRDQPLCNDGSRAQYYLRKASGGPNSCWVLYVKGGAMCVSDRSCIDRFRTKTRIFMTASLNPASLTGATVLSTDKKVNPAYAECNHVYVPYCSSDLYLGRRTTKSAFGFRFQGHGIFRGVIHDLLNIHSMSLGASITAVGSSAGSIGIMVHLNWLVTLPQLKVQRSARRIRFISDSGMMVSVNNSLRSAFKNMSINEVVKYWGAESHSGTLCAGQPSPSSCVATSGVAILADHVATPPDVPIFLITAQYDAFMLAAGPNIVDWGMEKNLHNGIAGLLSLEQYGGATRKVVNDIAARRFSISSFMVSCFQHKFLTAAYTCDTDDKKCIQAFSSDIYTEVMDGRVKITYQMNENVWKETRATGTSQHCARNTTGAPPSCWTAAVGSQERSLAEAISEWAHPNLSTMVLRPPNSADGLSVTWEASASFLNASFGALSPSTVLSRSIYHSDCVGAMCSTSCPTSFDVNQAYAADPAWLTATLKTVIMTFSIFIGLLTLLSICVYVKHVQCRRKIDAYSDGTKDALPTEGLSSNLASQDDTIGIAWKNLSYWAPNHRNPAEGFPLLHNVSGYLNPGQMMAVMGPSGSGKTTMMDTIAGRREDGVMQGDLLVNGRSFADKAVKKLLKTNIGYMVQLAEAWSPGLTLRENLIYSAYMRLPAKMAGDEKLERVEQVIDEIGLRDKANVLVGGATGGGLSGGQKRLLMFGIEVLSLPSILFLDEPTSGLDSTSSLHLIATLKNFCATGRSVVLTIHQPREEIFVSFNTLCLMFKGAIAYFGDPLYASEFLMKYATQIRHIEEEKFKGNPGDIVIDTLDLKTGPDQKKIGLEVVKMFHESGITQAIIEQVDRAQSEVSETLRARALEGRGSTVVAKDSTLRGSWTHIWTMHSRKLSEMTRGQYFGMTTQLAALVPIIGTLYFRPQKLYVVGSMFFQFHAISMGTMASPCIQPYFESQTSMYHFEQLAGVTGPTEFLLWQTMHTSFVTIFAGQIIFIAPLLCVLVDFEELDILRLGVTFFFYVLNCHAIFAMYMFICSAFRYGHIITGKTRTDHTQAMIVSVFVQTGVFNVFGGIYQAPQHMPIALRWFCYCSPTYYLFSALLRINLEGFSLKGTCNDAQGLVLRAKCLAVNDGASYLKHFEYQDTDVAMHALFLVFFYVTCTLGAWLFLNLSAGTIKRPKQCKKPLILKEHSMQKVVQTVHDNTQEELQMERDIYNKEAPHLDKHAWGLVYTPCRYDAVVGKLACGSGETLDARQLKVQQEMSAKYRKFRIAVTEEHKRLFNRLHENIATSWAGSLDLTEDHAIEVAKRTFAQFDTNGNAILDVHEFSQACQQLDLAETDEEAVHIFIGVDTNNDEEISLEEFILWYTSRLFKARMLLDVANDRFDMLDKDNDGLLSLEEFQQIFSSHEQFDHRCTVDDIKAAVGSDPAGVISLYHALSSDDGEVGLSKVEFTDWFIGRTKYLTIQKPSNQMTAETHICGEWLGLSATRSVQRAKKAYKFTVALDGTSLMITNQDDLGGFDAKYRFTKAEADEECQKGQWKDWPLLGENGLAKEAALCYLDGVMGRPSSFINPYDGKDAGETLQIIWEDGMKWVRLWPETKRLKMLEEEQRKDRLVKKSQTLRESREHGTPRRVSSDHLDEARDEDQESICVHVHDAEVELGSLPSKLPPGSS